MSLIDIVKRYTTGLALRINALIIPGAGANQVLATQDDGNGGFEFVPVSVEELGGDDSPLAWSPVGDLLGVYPNGSLVRHDGHWWQNQSGGSTTSADEPGVAPPPTWVLRDDVESELDSWTDGPTFISYYFVTAGTPAHVFANVSGGSLNGVGSGPVDSPGDWLDIGPVVRLGTGHPPTGTGLASVTNGGWDVPATLRARVAADAANLRADLGLTTLASLGIGTAGQRIRTNVGATSGEWADPDLVCTFAELSTTHAPSAVLRGVIAYATDKLATYVCRSTGVSSYAWRCIHYDREMPGGATALAWWRLQEAAGATSFANSGTGGVVALAATTSGSGASVLAGTGCGPWGQPCVSLSQSASGAAYLESASGVIEPAYPITVSLWIRAQGTSIGAETNSRYGKKYIAAYTPITNAVGFTVLAVTSTSGPYGAGSAVCVGGVVTFSPTVRGVLGGGWSLLTATYDGTTHTCYVNGRTPGGTAQSGAIDYGTGSGRTWYFGSSPVASTDRLNGQMSEIRVVGSAWTAAQVLEAYQRGVGCWDGGL